MQIGTFQKSVPIDMVKLDSEEFERDDLARALEELEETSPNDKLGYNGLKDYEAQSSYDTLEKLVKLGYAIFYRGERQSRCYKKSPEAFDQLRSKFKEIFPNVIC